MVGWNVLPGIQHTQFLVVNHIFQFLPKYICKSKNWFSNLMGQKVMKADIIEIEC